MDTIKVINATTKNLKNVSIEIPLNQFVVLVGKSGSGKSTLAVDVIIGSYLNKNENANVPLIPALFKQRITGLAHKCSLLKYLNKKENADYLKLSFKDYLHKVKMRSKFTARQIEFIASKFNVIHTNLNKSISEMSLTEYNKFRFLQLLMNSNAQLFIIDELGAGMLAEEAFSVAEVLKYVVSLGYSIISIEHSMPIITAADYIIEMGPGAGTQGGKVIFNGLMKDYKKTSSWQSMVAIFNKKLPPNRGSGKTITVEDINYRNFSSFNLSIPLGSVVAICGGMGSGKSTLIDIIFRAFDKSANAWKNKDGINGAITGKNYIRRPYIIDQTPIGNNSMSTPATYIGLMDGLRNFYLTSEENSRWNLSKSDFSYNASGKCLACGGKGCVEIDANDEIIYLACKACNGSRYTKSIDSVRDNGMSIGNALQTTCADLYKIYLLDKRKFALNLKIGFLNKVGLSYLTLGQPSGSLSGGESQRIKITKELAKKLGDRCLFILDSPAKDLHVDDFAGMMSVLKQLVDKKNSIIICENQPFFVNNSDWVIFLDNGKVSFQGRPEALPVRLKKKLGAEMDFQ